MTTPPQRGVLGDDVAAAMIDRLVHHAEVIALKGDSYRLKDRDLGGVTTATTDDSRTRGVVNSQSPPAGQVQIQLPLTPPSPSRVRTGDTRQPADLWEQSCWAPE